MPIVYPNMLMFINAVQLFRCYQNG